MAIASAATRITAGLCPALAQLGIHLGPLMTYAEVHIQQHELRVPAALGGPAPVPAGAPPARARRNPSVASKAQVAAQVGPSSSITQALLPCSRASSDTGCAVVGADGVALRPGRPAARTPRTRCRAPVGSAGQFHLFSRRLQAFDNGQARPRPVVGAAFVQAAVKRFRVAVPSGMPGPWSLHLDAQMPAMRRQPATMRPRRLAKADGVGDKVLQYAAGRVFVGAHHGAGGHTSAVQTLAFGQHAKVVANTCSPNLALSRTCAGWPFHARDIEQVENGILRGRAPSMLSAACARLHRAGGCRKRVNMRAAFRGLLAGPGQPRGFWAVGAFGLLRATFQVRSASFQ